MMHSGNCATSYCHGGTLSFVRLCTDGSHVVSTMRCVNWVADISGTICTHIIRTPVDVKYGVRFKAIQPVPFVIIRNYRKILTLLHSAPSSKYSESFHFNIRRHIMLSVTINNTSSRSTQLFIINNLLWQHVSAKTGHLQVDLKSTKT